VTTNEHLETSADIDEAAATWATRLDGEPLTPDETQILETWLAGDPRRRGALARAMAILAHPGRGFCA
jgi:transmembrane sensor